MPNPPDLTQPATPGGSALAWLRRVMAGLGCTPVECVALSVLVAGAVAALGILWMAARPGAPGAPGAPPPPPADGGGVQVEAEEVVVHVSGAVASPEVYRLPGGSRVADALAAAGGPLPDAVLDSLNLARPLTDGEQVVVPVVGAPVTGAAAPAPGAAGALSPATRPDGKLDLNRATTGELDTLPGIGPVLAERIVSYREEHGPFKAVGRLRDVPGIGEKTFQRLAPLLAVG